MRQHRCSLTTSGGRRSTGTNGILLKDAERPEIWGNRVENTAQGINPIESNRNIATYNATTDGLSGIVLTGRQNEFDHNNASGID